MSGQNVHGHDAGQDRPGAPHTTQAEGDGPVHATNDGPAQGEHPTTGSADTYTALAADQVRTSDPAGRDGAATRPSATLVGEADDGRARGHAPDATATQPLASREPARETPPASAWARAQKDTTGVVPSDGADGRAETLAAFETDPDQPRNTGFVASGGADGQTENLASPQAEPDQFDSTGFVSSDRADGQAESLGLPDADPDQLQRAPAHSAVRSAGDDGEGAMRAVLPGHGAASAPAAFSSPGDAHEAAAPLTGAALRDAAEPGGTVSPPNDEDEAAASLGVAVRDLADPPGAAPASLYDMDEAATLRAAVSAQDPAESHAPVTAPSHDTGEPAAASRAIRAQDQAEPPDAASTPPHDADEAAASRAAARSQHQADQHGPAITLLEGKANAPALPAAKEDEVTATRSSTAPLATAGPGSQAWLPPSSEDAVTTNLAAGPPHVTEAASPSPPPPYDEDEVTTVLVAASSPAAAGPDGRAHAPLYDEDEVTTVLVAASSPAAGGPDGSAHAPPYDEDEVTTVLVAASPSAAAGPDSPARTKLHDTDEVTTAPVAASSPAARGPDDLAHAAAYEEDEVTTVLVAPVADPAGPQDRTPTFFDADEVTTVLVGAAGPGKAESASSPPAAPRVGTGPADDTASSEDDVTTTVAAAEPDERTTVVQTEAAALASAPGAANRRTPDQLPDGHTGALAAQPAGSAARATSHAANADEPVTEVIQISRPPGTAASDPDRHWFDVAFSQFMTALRQDEAGRPRPQEERHALAAAARDTITRVAMQTVRSGEGWATDTVLQPDQLLANTYTVRSLIARGGIGEIYRVRHRDLKTEHAIKILLPHYALDATMQTLMLDEARLLRRVQHEAVVRAQDLLRDADGRPMLVMDYIRGRTLASRLRESQLSAPELLALTRRLADGLSAIHATGIVHQDISPDNIILAEDSCATATIIDFGLARVVGAGRDTHRNLDFAGKYSWSSPEQLSGRPAAVDARSDLYSLGLILAAATRGYRLEMGNDLESARAARRTVPSLSGVEEPMRGLLARLLAPAPDARLASASEIHGMLEPKRVSWWRGWLGM